MTISWKGQSCFQISISQNKNGSASIVIDPFSNEIGLRVPKFEVDVLLITHDHHDHNNSKAVSGQSLVINGPGEYDVKEIFIQGIEAFHDDVQGKERGPITIYTIEAEDIRVCHLGDLGQKELTAEQLEKIGNVDILMIPIGGDVTLDAKEAIKVMSQIEPKVIIPMHYKIPKLKTKAKLASLDDFLKALGVKTLQPLPKLSVKKKDLSGEEAKVIVLEP